MTAVTGDVLTRFGLTPVVNAAGKMTYLGGSACDAETAAALATAARAWVDMSEMMHVAGERVASATGAEAGFVTDCAAAGIAVAAAACVTGGDPGLVAQVPRLPDGIEHRIVLQKGHAVDFGAPLPLMLRLGGAEVVEVGTSNRCTPELVESAVRRGAAAIAYVVSHHVTGDELCSLSDVLDVAYRHDVPVLVDAAAETDLRGYVASGADLVVYSGHKAVGGPTSGMICGRRDLIAACAAQQAGIGRATKIGKENVAGLLVALDTYTTRSPGAEYARLRELADLVASALRGLTGLDVEIVSDTGRPIPRTRVHVWPDEAGVDAVELVRRLAAGTPPVRCRAHHAARGFFDLDPRPLGDDGPALLGAAVRRALKEE